MRSCGAEIWGKTGSPARRRPAGMQVGKHEKRPLPSAWKIEKASRFYRNNRYFFCSTARGEVKSEFKEKLENMQIFSEASAADAIIKICPRLAGNGSVCDYAMRPASRCRWARPVRRDTGECARIKPACAAGRLC